MHRLREGADRPAPPEAIIETDPSEALRSDEIVPLLESRFDVLYRADFGGTLLQFVLADIAANFSRTTPGRRALDLMSLLEEVLIAERVLPSDFASSCSPRAIQGPAAAQRRLPERLGERPTELVPAETLHDELDEPGLDALPELPFAVEPECEPRELAVDVGDEHVLEVAQPEPFGSDWRSDERQARGHGSISLSLIPAPKRSGWT